MDTEPTAVAQPPRPSSAVRVLIVDDDDDARDALVAAVDSLGFTTKTASDGLEAWEMFASERADVILSDWTMPRMDGLSLCKKVRDEVSGEHYTHFILVTANADKAHVLDGMHGGADAYVTKPVDLEHLELCLDVACRLVLFHRRTSRP